MFGRYGLRNLDTYDQPNIPLPSGGAGNGHIYAATSSSCSARRGCRATSLLEARFGYSWTQAGKNPPALGTTARSISSGCPGLPTDDRIAGGLPTQLITRLLRPRPPGHQPAVAVPDRLQPEDQLHVDDAARTRSRPATSSSTSTREVQDVNPLYGRDTYNGQFTPPGRRRGEQSL